MLLQVRLTRAGERQAQVLWPRSQVAVGLSLQRADNFRFLPEGVRGEEFQKMQFWEVQFEALPQRYLSIGR